MENLMKRAFLFLETGEFDKATEYFEKILDADCENGQAYLGRLMVERQVSKPEDLGMGAVPLENSVNYQMIMRFGDEELKKQVSQYNQDIKNVLENMRLEEDYQKAKTMMEHGTAEEYEEAAEIFTKLGEYKDSQMLSGLCACNAASQNEEEARKDNRFIKIVVLIMIAFVIAGIVMIFKPSCGEGKSSKKEYSKLLAVGGWHTVGLKPDGTVVATGLNDEGQCDVSGWHDIVAVSAGGWHTVGLKSDGTVAAVGRNLHGQCDVSGWRDIVAVSAGGYHTVGLKSDGTVVAVGYNAKGQCDVSGWRDIVAVSAGEIHTVGLKSDGTVVAVGYNGSEQCDVSGWHDIVAVSAGSDHTVGLKPDGTVVDVGSKWAGKCDVSEWSDIVAVSVAEAHAVGLKSDGTVVDVSGLNSVVTIDYGQCDVSEWRDIVAVAAGDYHTVGLKSDGTVVAVGYNDDGQCDVSGWDLID